MRSVAANAELALLLEVASTPKPGNVDRHRDHPGLRFEHFVAGAVGALPGLEALQNDAPLGEGFETAIEGLSQQSGGNTQFGAVLLLAPLVRAAARDRLTPAGARETVRATTVADAAGFYRAFDHVDVAVGEHPADVGSPDVRDGSDAVPILRERGLTLGDVMAESAPYDGVAAEWTGGFSRTFDAAEKLRSDSGPIADRAAAVYLSLLAEEPDPFVSLQHDEATAAAVRERAAAARRGEPSPERLAEEFVERGINPGTTADLIAGALFVALERGLTV